MSLVFSDEKLMKYVETRLSGKNVGLEELKIFRLWNGYLPSMLEGELQFLPEQVIQENPREPLSFRREGSELFIPQYSHFGRAKRYQRMIEQYIRVSGRTDLEFCIRDLSGNPRETAIAYERYAYDFVTGLFLQEERHAKRRLLPTLDMAGVQTVIFGPLDAVARQARVLEKGKTEYLDAQIVEVAKNPVLNVGYVYAEQAGIIIDKMLREWWAVARKKGDLPMKVNIFMFGREGALLDSMRRQELVAVTGAIDEIDIRRGTVNVYPIHNVFEKYGKNGFNLNVTSVVDEDYCLLEMARDLGCSSIEMEVRESDESVNRGRRRYEGVLEIDFGHIGYVSDRPFCGETLADEDPSTEGQDDAVGVILDHLKRQ